VRKLLTASALLILAAPAWAQDGYGAVGVSGGLGIGEVSTTVGGGVFKLLASKTSVQFCAGGQAFLGRSMVRFGVEGQYCTEVAKYWKMNTWFVEPFIGVDTFIGSVLGGIQIGVGYGQLREDNYDYRSHYVPIRPQVHFTVPSDHVAFEFAFYGMLPVPVRQSVGDARYTGGWFPWFGAEIGLLFGDFRNVR
jgi:hypothetical protein